jgi:hypothetical protein
VSSVDITLCVASQRVFIVVYFVMTQSEKFWIHPRTLLYYLIQHEIVLSQRDKESKVSFVA